MKKLAFMFVAFAAISFASCGNKAAQAEDSCCEDSVCCGDSVEVVEEVATDSVEGDTVVVEAATEVVAE